MFVGRKNELQEIYDRLHKSTDKPMAISRIVVISGSEGVGESELARKYACEYKEHYDGNLVWVNAGTQKDLEESFKGLAKELNRRLPEGSKFLLQMKILNKKRESDLLLRVYIDILKM